MFPRDLANCAFRHAPSGRPTGVAETITGGATIAAISGARPTQSARCTAIVDEAIVSVSDICPSPLVHVVSVTPSNDRHARGWCNPVSGPI
jgi:hypothetical protein